ncbi:MAG: PEP-CTERM sorting domain-containing protein [bacterium]|nr:PEP-CTERM sorting domain-containing protein [bacterium]
MKRVLLCAMCVLMAGVAANAADVELKHNGIRNDEFTLALGGVDVVELWITFQDDAGGSGANIGDNGKAVWISSGIQIDSLMQDNSDLPADPFVEWPSGHAADGLDGDGDVLFGPGGLSVNGRIGTAGTTSFDEYNLIYQDASEGAFPFPVSHGWSAADGLTYHADNIAVRGMLPTAPGQYQKLFHPGADAAPAWDEGRVYVAGTVIGFLEQDKAIVLLSKKGGGNHIKMHVVPEPASLALLVIGGLAAVRRRR